MRLNFYLVILGLVGCLASGEVKTLKPEDPQKSELQEQSFEAKKVIPDASPEKPVPQLYRAWRNPNPQTKRPADTSITLPNIKPSVKQPAGKLSKWDKKKWESGKSVRLLEVNKDFDISRNPLFLKDYERFVYRRNRK